jgi:hypothetical protein
MKFSFFSTLILATGFTTAIFSQDLGITFGFNSSARSSTGGTNNHSLFKPTGTEADWWDDMVEEVSYSGVDYIAPVCRGYSPSHPNTDAGDPRKLPNLCAAMDRRPLDNTFKIAIFDDCPASWTANRNLDNGQGYDYSPLFDCADTANYKYIWDYNIKLCIQNIPDAKRYKINNRMVIIFWTITNAFAVNQKNNLKKILLRLRADCQASFGFNPYLIVDRRFFDDDPSTNDPAVVDAAHNWFAAPYNSWTLQSFNNVKIGCLCPGFATSASGAFMDPSHGQRLLTGLNGTVKAGALLTLGEGFTDEEEGAAWWRSNDAVYYDYPNQRLNITRRYTSKAFADNYKIEAEACDTFANVTSGTPDGTYRNGAISIAKCADTNLGWFVTKTKADGWLEWKELPIPAKAKFMLRYSSTVAASAKISVDGAALSTVTLPSTSGKWSTIDAGDYSGTANGLHTVRLAVVSGAPDLNYFTIRKPGVSTSSPEFKRKALPAVSCYGTIITMEKAATSRIKIPFVNGRRYYVEFYTTAGKKLGVCEVIGKNDRAEITLPASVSGALFYRVKER